MATCPTIHEIPSKEEGDRVDFHDMVTPLGRTLSHDTGICYLPTLSTSQGLFHGVAIGKIVLKYKSQSCLVTLNQVQVLPGQREAGGRLSPALPVPGPGHCPLVQGSGDV